MERAFWLLRGPGQPPCPGTGNTAVQEGRARAFQAVPAGQRCLLPGLPAAAAPGVEVCDFLLWL